MKRAAATSSMPSFENAAQKRSVVLINIIYLIAAACLLLCAGLGGAAAIVGGAVCVLIYRHRAYTYFGGVTGDLSGWLLQVSELTMLTCVILGRCILP